MKVENLKVYDLEESLIASGYPMRTDLVEEVTDKAWNRGYHLIIASRENPAHAQWLTGVRVSFDLTCSNKMWVEAERYRFLEFVSSQSTMHKISKFDIRKCCNSYVDDEIISILEDLQECYANNPTQENYLRLLYNVPSGFELTARLTTNYRCLLNIYLQRHNHRLPEWREFCQYMLDNLPKFQEMVSYYLNNE